MTEAVRSRAFEPFFSTKPKEQGTGLGLSTVYGIVKQAGGDASIYSELLHGTTVKIYLPGVPATENAEPAEHTAVRPARGWGELILVVEDDGRLRAAIERMLIEHGYNTLSAASAEEALALLKVRSAPDLLVSDVILPGLSGPDLAQQLQIVWPELRVLFVSGYTGQALRNLHLGQGFDLLGKPFAAEALLAKVAALLHRDDPTL